jgi:hypothetical protein
VLLVIRGLRGITRVPRNIIPAVGRGFHAAHLARRNLTQEISNRVFRFQTFFVPAIPEFHDLRLQHVNRCGLILNNGVRRTRRMLLFASGKPLFQLGTISTELLLTLGHITCGFFDFISISINLHTQTIKEGLNIAASLLQSCASDLRRDTVTDKIGSSFFNNQTLLQNLRLSLIQF